MDPQNQNQGPAFDIAQALVAIQAQLQNLGTRMAQLEQPRGNQPARRVAARNNPLPQSDDEEEDMPGLEDDIRDAPDPPPLRRDPNNRGRIREEDFQRGNPRVNSDVKITLPTFSGKVNPEAYLDWETRMEYIFDCYGYNERKKVAVAAAQLTEYALTWWNREITERRRNRHGLVESWHEMKHSMRRRYVPPHYHREIQRKFRKLSQGSRTVEEYYDEFEQLRNRLELDDTEEALMAQFSDGLQERISRKVERQPYHQMHELLHLAIQVEQQIKCKAASTSRPKTNTSWIPPARTLDKGKALEIESKFKKQEPTKGTRPDLGKSPTPSKSSNIVCFKCQGRGHMARECPNNRVMIITPNGDYESEDEQEQEEPIDLEDDVQYPDHGELLVTRRVLSTMIEPEETIQRENIFHTRCTINAKVCSLIIDGGSCTNVASRYMVDKLSIPTSKHPRPYKIRWLNDQTELKVNEQAVVPFSIGKYHDKVLCDVVPMQASHLLLGRPWQFDREATHNGRTNLYTFTYDKKKYTLAPLTPTQVHEMQSKVAKSNEVKKG